MFQQILAIFMATKPIEKIDSFSDVSIDFGHFSGYKTHWQKLTIFQMFQHILASFLATKLIEKWLTVFRCFNRYWPFFWQQNPLKKIDSFQMFHPILDIFLATKPIEKNWLFSDVSTDFGHFYGDEPYWRKWQLFRCFNRFWPFFGDKTHSHWICIHSYIVNYYEKYTEISMPTTVNVIFA